MVYVSLRTRMDPRLCLKQKLIALSKLERSCRACENTCRALKRCALRAELAFSYNRCQTRVPLKFRNAKRTCENAVAASDAPFFSIDDSAGIKSVECTYGIP